MSQQENYDDPESPKFPISTQTLVTIAVFALIMAIRMLMYFFHCA